VKEYWIVYPEEKMVMVFTLDENGNYGKPMTYFSEEEIAVGVLPDLKVPLDRVFE
jgi:Uma2 family endonuclease